MAPHNFPLPYTQANTNEKSPMVGLICSQSQIKNGVIMNSCTDFSGCELLKTLSSSQKQTAAAVTAAG